MATVVQGDAINLIPNLGTFDFCFLDPPFNIGQEYLEYHDDVPPDDYNYIIRAATLLSWKVCTGVMCLYGPDELVKVWLKMEDSAGMTRVNWVQWFYDFGQNNPHGWTDSRCHILVYAKGDYTKNPDDVRIPSARAEKYKDKRTKETKTPGMRMPGKIWGLPQDGQYWGRVVGNSKERVPGCPNQLPEKLMERLILYYTNPGDRCLDPFGGSGTTAVVANALGRECVTIDMGKENCELIEKRLEKGAVRVG